MINTHSSTYVLTTLLIPAALLPVSCSQREQRPNILFILADDYGWKDTGCTGSTYYETPNIDRIAAEGVNFTYSYSACHVSSPTRASIMTGLFPSRHRVTQWMGEPFGEDWRNKGRKTLMLSAPYDTNLAVDEFPCLPRILHDAGYTTFMAGKWHLGEQTTPEKAGFDINIGGYKAGSPAGGYFVPYKNPKLPDGPAGENLSRRLGDETAAFIRSRRKGDAPFFIYLSFYAVHNPLQTTEELWRHFREKASSTDYGDSPVLELDGIFTEHKRQDNPVYAGVIRQMDDAIGDVLAELHRKHLDRNTLIIFTSDNGGLSAGGGYSTSNAPLRGGKGTHFEGGTRIPLIISTPELSEKGRTLAGSSCDVPVHTVDMLPTILEYAGLPVPEGVDGVSLLPLLRGGDIPGRTFYWHYPHYSNRLDGPTSYLVDAELWKLVHFYEDGHDELYNLREDPYEECECSTAHPDVAERLRADLDRHLAETGAIIPEFDPLYDEDAHRKYMDNWLSRDIRSHLQRDSTLLSPSWEPDPTWWGSEVD